MDEEDDFGFLSAGRSRLSSLFQPSGNKEEDVNQSLTYVAPKQPKKNDGQQQGNTNKSMTLIHAIPAYAYKLEGGQYVSVGKLGTALVGDNDTSNFTLILYKGKQQHVAKCTIDVQFQFSVESNNYAKFPDDKGDQWSIMFTQVDELIAFSKQVALAKANSFGKNLTKIIVQDLVAGEGAGVENGDSVEIVYTGYLFKNFALADVFDDKHSKSEKPLVVRLGKSKIVKGLSEGLSGATKGMQRFVIVPSALGYGSEGLANLVPPNSVLAYDVYVKRVKLSRDASHSPGLARKDSDTKPDVPPRSHPVSEDTIRSRGASISEQLTQSPRKDNAKLISRMAKMGLPTLPMQGAVVAAAHQTSSESEPEKEQELQRPQSRKQSSASSSPKLALSHGDDREADLEEVVPLQRRKHASTPKASSPQLQITSMPYVPYQTQPMPLDATAFMHQPFQTHTITPVMPPAMPGIFESHIPLLVSETRTQNTEVRISLAKIADKVDTVLQKLEDTKAHAMANNPMLVHGQVPYMESLVLMQNIERIVQENASLKKENVTKSTKIQELNEKICDILQRNQRFFEESNSIIEQQSDSLHMTAAQLQNKIMSLEKEKAEMAIEVNQATSKASDMQSELRELEKLTSDLRGQLQVAVDDSKGHSELAASLKEQCIANEVVISSLRNNLDLANKQTEELNERLKGVEEKANSAKESEEELKSQMALLSNSSGESTKSLQNELQREMAKNLQLKRKYETLHENTRTLKDKYEAQINELVTELKKMKNASLQSSVQPTSQEFSSEIKRAMNVLYKLLQSEVKTSESYSGTEVLQMSLSVIRRVTLALIGKDQQQQVEGTNQKSTAPESLSKGPSEEKLETVNSAGGDHDHPAAPQGIETGVAAVDDADGIRHDKVEDNFHATAAPQQADSEIAVVNELTANTHELGDSVKQIIESKDSAEKTSESNESSGDTKGELKRDSAATEQQNEQERKSPDMWKPQPPPLFDDEEEDEDDWLK